MATSATKRILKDGRRKRKAIAGFEPPPFNPNEASRDTYLYHKGMIDKAEREAAPYKKAIKDARRRAEDEGVNLKRLDMLTTLMNSRDSGKTIREYMEKLFQEAAWLKIIPWQGQGSLFEHVPNQDDEKARLEAIWNDGRDVGLSSGACECPYDETSTEGQVWLDGYDTGHEKLQAMFLQHNADKAAKAEEEGEQT